MKFHLLPAVLVSLAFAGPAAAIDGAMTVALDQAKVVRLEGPVDTIVIGNPAIADASLQDARTLVITGRSYGTTNLIVLNEAGDLVSETQISVEGPVLNSVTVFRGAKRTTMNCVPTCQPAQVPGDDQSYFSAIAGQTTQRNGAATGAPTDAAPAPDAVAN